LLDLGVFHSDDGTVQVSLLFEPLLAVLQVHFLLLLKDLALVLLGRGVLKRLVKL
jgi:hypothetical protein